MEHRYTQESGKPEFDTKITAWLNTLTPAAGSAIPYPVAICHNGAIYREIIGNGLSDYVSLTGFLRRMGLVNLLRADAKFQGYSAIFATQETRHALRRGDKNPEKIPLSSLV